ncbi:MAG: hypothetical protein JOZ10_07150 [Acidobacteria bacterium]|nr:hypothetical protein [Acidobacteriota bacterium]MBV9144885.1 hypothetical protein [Acidobacteriota bacterium]
MKSGKLMLTLLGAVLLFVSAALADQFKMRAGESNPAAMGIVHVNTDRNGNLELELDAKHLAPPDRLTPAHSSYVVWIQPSGKSAEVLGQLRVNNKDEAASFKTSVPYHNFDVFVTAEDNPKPDMPGSIEVLRASVQK